MWKKRTIKRDKKFLRLLETKLGATKNTRTVINFRNRQAQAEEIQDIIVSFFENRTEKSEIHRAFWKFLMSRQGVIAPKFERATRIETIITVCSMYPNDEGPPAFSIETKFYSVENPIHIFWIDVRLEIEGWGSSFSSPVS